MVLGGWPKVGAVKTGECLAVCNTLDPPPLLPLAVHRAALACGSEFFGAMLLSGMRESQGTEVSLHTISAQDLRLLVSFAYSGVVRARWPGLLRATQAALRYQSSSCLALCQRALAQGLNPARCLALIPMAEAPGLERLWSKARHYLLTHLPAVALCSTFPSLPVACLAQLLDSDELHLQEEFEAFAAALRWLAANPDTQESEAKALLRCVRFGRMSTRELRRVRAARLPPPLSPDLLRQLMVEAEVPGQERRREPDQALVVIGGDGLRSDMATRQPSRGVWWARAFRCGVGLVRTVEWGQLPALPAPGRFRHGAASLAGSELYVCGGQDFYGHSNTLASTLRYGPLRAAGPKVGSCGRLAAQPTADSQGHSSHLLSHCVQVGPQARGLGGDGTFVPGSELFPPGGAGWTALCPGWTRQWCCPQLCGDL